MLTICGKGLPNVIVCETKMLGHIFMHSVNWRKNDDVFEDFFKVHWAACNDVNHLFQRIPHSFSVSLIKGLKENSKITSLRCCLKFKKSPAGVIEVFSSIPRLNQKMR